MRTIINGRLILPEKICAGNLTFDEKIISIGEPISGAEVIDAENNFVSAGFINIHIHGAAGVDTMDEDIAALKKLAEFLPSTGVTSFLPTTMTMPLEKIYRALERIRLGRNFISGAKILGANVEGPFISKKFKGAQAEENILPADFELFDFIDRCRAENIIVSIGHSAATYEEAMTAIERGANHITHLFNAQTGFHHRKPGIVGAALDSSAIVELLSRATKLF